MSKLYEISEQTYSLPVGWDPLPAPISVVVILRVHGFILAKWLCTVVESQGGVKGVEEERESNKRL